MRALHAALHVRIFPLAFCMAQRTCSCTLKKGYARNVWLLQTIHALHAFFGLRRHTDFNKLKPSLAFKIFDSMISPILTYNSEVWGAFAKSDFKSSDSSAIEKTHLQFCKRYLEVHNKASNIACRAELGKFPLIIDINKKILKYLNYLREKEESSIVKQSLKISIDLHYNGHNSFYSSLTKMTDYYNFCDFNCNSLNEGKIKQYEDLMKKKYLLLEPNPSTFAKT